MHTLKVFKNTEALDIKLIGYIASDTFTSRTNSHFADEEGNVICKQKCRFGYDCHTVVKFVSIDEIYSDQFRGTLWKYHLPFETLVTCKNCQKRVRGIFKNFLVTK
jgi:hypothetical protein